MRLRIDNPRWGARTLHTKLVQAGLKNPPVVSTVHRVLKRHGLVNTQSARKPQQWKRFERIAPNDLWQIDGTQVALSDGSKAWIVNLIDDHARYAIGATAVRRFTVHAAWSAMETAVTEHGAPRQLISDNGLQFTSRKGQKPVYFQDRLTALGVKQLSSRPRHPQTCGKLERYHRTFKEYYADHGPAATVDELQVLCDRFRWYYNHERPHRSLQQQTPALVYAATGKVAAGDAAPRRPKTPVVASSGTLTYLKRKINVGTAHAGCRLRVLELGDERILIETIDGHLVRELTLGERSTYHRGLNGRGRPRKNPTSSTPELASTMS